MKTRKIFAACLAAVLLLSALTVFSSAEDGVSPIRTAEEYAAMNPSGSYRLEADLTLTKSYAKTFTGTLDGNGHTVTVSAPMFAVLNGTVKNLTINGTANSSVNSGALSISSTEAFRAENVVNNASVTAFSNVGGFVGDARSAVLIGCVNNGNVTASGSGGEAGGFLGHPANFAGTCGVILENCVNHGDIFGGQDAGGFIANMGLSGNAPEGGAYIINKGLNTGNVTGARYGGGFVGYVYGSGANAYLSLTYCTNTGTVAAGRPTSAGFVSEFIAYTNSASTIINYCVGAGDLTAVKGANTKQLYYVIVGCSSADMMKCNILGIFLCDNGKTAYYSYATADTNAANRHVLSAKTGGELINRCTAEELAGGEICRQLNYISASNDFLTAEGLPMHKSIAYMIGAATEPEEETGEITTAPSTGAEEPTEVPTEEPTEEPDPKGCGSAALAWTAFAGLFAAAVVTKKRH